MPDSNIEYDVAVIGAGPAGLFAATEIVAARGDLRLVIFDQGPGHSERVAAESTRSRTGDWLTGFGGAGFFIGGRMAYDFSTPTGWPSHIDSERVPELVGVVDARLAAWGVRSPVVNEVPSSLQQRVNVVEEAGLTWRTNFPARHLTAAERVLCMNVIQEAFQAAHADMRLVTHVKGVHRSRNAWEVALETAGTRETITAAALIIAPGRAGAGWLASLAASLGVTASRQTSVGVRIETPSEAVAPFTDVSLDPRLFLQVPQGNFRTYAWVTGGYVTAAHEGDRPRISCRSGGDVRTGNTNFSILKDTAESNHVMALGRATVADILPGFTATADQPATFVPSLDIDSRDIRNDFSTDFWDGLSDFLTRMNTLAPALASAPAWVYTPAIESTWTYGLDGMGFTGVPGLYLAGDGAGVSQGAMAAAISGLVCGQAVVASR